MQMKYYRGGRRVINPLKFHDHLYIIYTWINRIPDSYHAKIAQICNLWTFWPVIQLINNLFKI